MRSRFAATLVITIAAGCGTNGDIASKPIGDDVLAEECEWQSAAEPADADVPLCDLEFREVVRLEGSGEGVAPDYPVQVFRDGTYVTGTYQRGKIAHWGPDGRFIGTLGTGPGEGPGEFDHASDLVQASDDEFFVFTGLQLVHRYSVGDGFLRSFRLPTYGGVSGAAAYEDGVVVSAFDLDGFRSIRIQGDSVEKQGVLAPPGGILLLTATEDVGVWSAIANRYVLRRHAWPLGAAVDSLVPDRDWFRGPEGREALLYGIQADSRGLIWAAGIAPTPDAPPRRRPAGVDMPVSEEDEAEAMKHTDFVIDAHTPDGRLVATVRFDTLEEAPSPMPAGLWYRRTPDELSIVILEAVLVARR